MTKQIAMAPGIRPMVHADLELVLAWRNHPSVQSYMYTQQAIAPKEHLQWFERTLADPRKQLLIFEPDKKPLGYVSFSELVGGGIADWGFYSAPDAPKGTGQKLGRAALDYAFMHCKFHKVCGQVLASNERSFRLHQTLGFKQEGVLRDQYFDGNRYQDVIYFGLLIQEWQSRS